MSKNASFSNILLTTWEEYRKAAKRSRQLKFQVNKYRWINFALLILGAIFGVLANQSVDGNATSELPKIFALLSTISLGVAAFLSSHVLDSSYEKQWIIARSQAEAFKSEAYIYLVKAPPSESQNRDQQLLKKLKEILGEDAQPVQLSQEEKSEKRPLYWLSMEDYLQERVKEQIETYYEKKAIEYKNLLRWLQTIGFLLGLIGAVLGAVSVVLTDMTRLAAWVAVIGTISGTLTAFTFAGRYKYLITSYELTARRLKWIMHEWDLLSKEDKQNQFGAFVRKFEDTISIENKSWVAEWHNEAEDAT